MTEAPVSVAPVRSRLVETYQRDLRLLIELTRKELRLRYRGSYLGYLWSILNPLALAFVFYVAFQVIMRFSVENYALVLVAGLFPWQWFSNSVQESTSLYFANRDLVKKAPLPKALLPLSCVLNHALNFAASVPVIFILVLVYGRSASWSWLYGVPLLMIPQAALAAGAALALAAANVFFRDLERIASVGMMMMFYLTPIIYPSDMIPEHLRGWLSLNPMYHLVTAFQHLFLDGVISWSHVVGSYVSGGLFLALGVFVHRRLAWRVPEAI